MSVRRDVIAALRFLEAHSTEPITLHDVADAVGYSPFHLTRNFKQAVGQAPMQYLAARRFYAAKALLLHGDVSITDICMQVGFSSLGTFTRRFVGEVGMSPSQFRVLPDQLTDHPAKVAHIPGPGGTPVRGSIRLTETATQLLGPTPTIFVGLFSDRAARGRPVCGSMLAESGPFVLTGVPTGKYWLLAGAFPDDVMAQLLPHRPVTGGIPHPISVPAPEAAAYAVVLQPPQEWETPITVALPALTSPRHVAPRGMMPLPR